MDPYEPAQRRSAHREQARQRLRRQRILAMAIAGFIVAGGAATVAILGGGGRSADGQGVSTVLQAAPTASDKQATATTTETDKTAATNTDGGGGSVQANLLVGATFAIDPGHDGGNFSHPDEINRLVDAGTLFKPCDTTGTATESGYTEAAYNLDVARRLARVLRKRGAKVVLTRTTDKGWGPCITERAAIANRVRADAAISIHADGGPPGGRGFHVIYPPPIQGLTDDIASASRKLALQVRRKFHADTGLPYANYVGRDGLDVRTDLGGLNLSDVPKVFIETGNMRNAEDARLLSQPAFRQNEAQALARGLERFLATTMK
jgi:N-acetylmuramoyl-L-alanine amidase